MAKLTPTIANGGTDTDDFVLVGGATLVAAPAALTGSVTLQFKRGDDAYTTVQHPAGTDVALAAAKAVSIDTLRRGTYRIHSDGAEGAERVFEVWFD